MLAFRMTADQAILFFEICEQLNAKTEEERTAILSAMSKLGYIESVTETKLSKEAYIKYIDSKFGNVINITKENK